MGRYWDDTSFYSQPTSAEIKRKSIASTQKEKSKGKTLAPIIITGRNIAESWWGKAWCRNLESYADYSKRITRGKRYVKSGAVIDMKISEGKVPARVQGTRKTPYKVEVKISPLKEGLCQEIIEQCSSRLENIEKLMSGDFPDDMKELFTREGGLFPSPREISFSCSCPDWALMCKHVAATLYGIGARFDEDLMLFFKIRSIDVDKFIDITLNDRVESMIANADKPSDRIITENVSELFGII